MKTNTADKMNGVKRLTRKEVARVNKLLVQYREAMGRGDYDAADTANGELIKATWKKCVSWDCDRSSVDWATGTGRVVHYDDPRKVCSVFYVG